MQMVEAPLGKPAYSRYKRMEAAWLALAEEQHWLDGETITDRSRREGGEGQMTGTPRRPWTPERDKELRALVLSANSVDTIARALNRTSFAIRRRANTLRLPLRKIARHRGQI